MRPPRLIRRVLALGAAVSACLAPAAVAREGYVASFGPNTVTVFETATNTVSGSQIPVGPNPSGIAITPNGARAYVANSSNGTVSVIDTATKTVVGGPIALGTVTQRPPAITPDGTRVYVGRANATVSVIDTSTNQIVGSPIAMGPGAVSGIAISPDGSRAYVARGANGTVSVIDIASNQVVGTIAVGGSLGNIAITPDGTRAYVTDRAADTVDLIDLVAGVAPGISIQVGAGPTAIAITPDGTRAYVANADSDNVSAIDLATNQTIGQPSPAGVSPSGVAISPDGGTAYVTNQDAEFFPDAAPDTVSIIDTATNTTTGSFEVGNVPRDLAIMPNQAPVASFTAPSVVAAGSGFTPDATGSSDGDGLVARYDWDFGDGTQLQNGGPTPTHSYSSAGPFTITLTVTDNEGCSATFVFTGQTASCNGAASARVTRDVFVDGSPPVLTLKGKKNQKVDGTVDVMASCDEACALLARGQLVLKTPAGGRSALATRKFNLKRLRADLDGGERKRLALRYSRKARTAAIEALRAGGRVRVRASVGATDAVGLSKTRSRRVTLKLP